MAITGQQVLDQALVLLDEVLETGDITSENPEYFRTKAKNILTGLQTELIPVNETPKVIDDLEADLLVSDRTALLILPYGLAAHLLLSEDQPDIASFYNNRYEELKRKMLSSIVPIIDVYYGGAE
ncbi:hypothetical protein [Fictibacillus phosphorivorans]|uniref:hypothetical protein n=1 Tax=Fictibacillus phosphorivorans TaxID=1221500 RepID=UPI0035EEA97E